MNLQFEKGMKPSEQKGPAAAKQSGQSKRKSESSFQESRPEDEAHSSSEETNEFWDNDPHLKARC